MKRIRKLFSHGIQNKIFLLILVTVLLHLAFSITVSGVHDMVTGQMNAESEARQQAAISEITSAAMDYEVEQVLERANWTEARAVDELLDHARDRVSYLADYTRKLLAHPERVVPQPCPGPEEGRNGEWGMHMIPAPGVDPSDPELAGRVGILGSMSEMIISLCQAYDAANVYIAIPEGVHLSVSDQPGKWLTEDGTVRSYDPRERAWYRQAVEAGGVILTDGGSDAKTGAYCLECAVPVYGPDGNLLAVVGTDVYLDDIWRVMRLSAQEGEFQLLLGRNGEVVLDPQEGHFPVPTEEMEKDMRLSRYELLSDTVTRALNRENVEVVKGELLDGTYYVTASSIPTNGWALLSAYSEEVAGRMGILLRDANHTIQEEVSEAYRGKLVNYRWLALILLVLVTLMVLVGSLLVGRRIVRPLKTMTAQIAGLGGENLKFDMQDVYRTGDEVQALAESFSTLSQRTMEYLDTVRRVTAEKEKIGTELALANQIQASMLPQKNPAFPDRTDFDVAASMDPAREVGGDFYDFFLVDEDHLCLVIADVSGKGIPAAMFMMSSKIILANLAMQGKSPAQILTDANIVICENNQKMMFVTVWLGIIELSTGKVKAANAGHEYPVIRRPNGVFEVFKEKHGPVVGFRKTLKFDEYELTLEPGSTLFVYTDGVPEATDGADEMFGLDRMVEALNREPAAAPQQILKNVRSAVDDFVKDAEQFDDLTMLCLEYRGSAPSGE